MRVLHLGKFYPPYRGGMETMLQLLCEGERQKIDSRVLVAHTNRITVRETVAGVPVTRVASVGSFRSVAICPIFPIHLWRQTADIIVIHEPNPVAVLSYCLVRPLGHLIVWYHSDVVRQRYLFELYRPFLRYVLRKAERIVVSSPKLAEHATSLQEFQSKVTIIPFGIDLAQMEATPQISKATDGLKNRYRAPIILFVGRMVRYKGIEFLLQALAAVKATTLLVGLGPCLSDLKGLATQLGIEDRTYFLGEVSQFELIALYHACDIFVLPSVSQQETFGFVQLEAMACGKPVVSTDLPSGVPWVNRHRETGFVVPPQDVPALRAALECLVADPELRRQMGARGYRHVVTDFSKERMVKDSLDLYSKVHKSTALHNHSSHLSSPR
jgi:glycosyltransferase involved in cell wall biosynthesis